MGGIAIDGECRVIGAEGAAIAGLFAAGSTTGGHEGGPVAGYTGGLGKAMTFGWRAGNCIAEQARGHRAGLLSAA
jgi:fumarate reductase flavoprotein subunit